jgi:hypothetical protein
MELGVTDNRVGIVLSDENGKYRARLGAAETQTPDGKTITYPESSLILFGQDGKVIWLAAPQ